jgi:uncharacterized tellurite resistance protein B-like protein
MERMNYKQFYIELGNLLYAIANADGAIQKEEYDQLYKLVREELLPLEDSVDEFGTDNAFYTEFEFEALMDRKASVSETFQSFVKFAKENRTHMDDTIKKICIHSVEKIARAYRGIDKYEQELIDNLKKEFKTL